MLPLLLNLIAQNLDQKITTIIQTCVVVDLLGWYGNLIVVGQQGVLLCLKRGIWKPKYMQQTSLGLKFFQHFWRCNSYSFQKLVSSC